MKRNQKKTSTITALSEAQVGSLIQLYSSGQISKAIDEIKKLNDQYPNESLLYNILGACYKALNDFENAEKMFKTAFTIKPDYAEAYFNHGIILKGLNRINDAIASYKIAVSIIPNYPDAYNNLGNAYREIGKISEAIDSYEWAIAYRPEFVQALNNLGNAQSDLGLYDQAIKNYHKALSLNSNYLEPLLNLGVAQQHLGLDDKAAESFDKLLKLQPLNLKAFRNLSTVKRFTKKDSNKIKKYESLLDNKDFSKSDLIHLYQGLSKAYEDLGDIDKQFNYLREGNNIRKNLLNYSIENSINLFSKIKTIFDPIPKKYNKKIQTIIKPIFIVGMPRSGTSLVEQIIASHKEVHGMGELNTLSEILAPIISEENSLISDDTINLIRQEYSTKIDAFVQHHKNVFTDKMPMNFRYIGFILSAFPEAKIVHLKRDARATCWSIYKHYFDSSGIGYSCDQKDLAKYYGLYSNLMNFWHELYPNKIYDISYENLTANQEEETRKLLKYCDLEWDENCLSFHKNERAVKTTSALQVRKKMYQGSSEAWKKYESYLEPLLKGLKSY